MLIDITEALIQDHTSPESFRRGEDYYRQGAVLSVTRRDATLQAEVAGSDVTPYSVRVSFDEAGITHASCSCPYDWGGWCKHIVATLLVCAHEPEMVRDLPALEQTLSTLDRDELEDLLLKLAERDPSLAGIIEGELSLSASSDARPVNTGAIRRRLRESIHGSSYRSYEDYWHSGGELDEARRILDGAWRLIRANDARGALPLLEAITEEYVESLEILGDYGGELIDFFGGLGAAWIEALLSVDDLTPHEKEDYSAKLDVWWGELGDYDAGDYFGAAFRAVEQGWSYPPLVRVLEGKVPDDEFFEEIIDDPLTAARLDVLERRGRYEEYLHLSEAAAAPTSHAIMLARLGRAEEAVEYGVKRLVAPEEALAVAEVLREQGDLEAAVRVGAHGLSLEGWKSELASWLRDLAEGAGRPELALEAALVAFRAEPDLTSYRRVRTLAGERWPEHRERLLDHLRQNIPYFPSGPVDVFLHEDLMQDAIAAVEQSPVGALVARVADAAIESHPEWVIASCRKRAEEIMDQGRSRYYADAVDWLAKVRDAYLADEREEEWEVYLAALIDDHRRKYRLRPMLEDLGKR